MAAMAAGSLSVRAGDDTGYPQPGALPYLIGAAVVGHKWGHPGAPQMHSGLNSAGQVPFSVEDAASTQVESFRRSITRRHLFFFSRSSLSCLTNPNTTTPVHL